MQQRNTCCFLKYYGREMQGQTFTKSPSKFEQTIQLEKKKKYTNILRVKTWYNAACIAGYNKIFYPF